MPGSSQKVFNGGRQRTNSGSINYLGNKLTQVTINSELPSWKFFNKGNSATKNYFHILNYRKTMKA
jgi:hypothetical protein